MRIFKFPIKSMIVIGSNTSDNGQSRFTEDVSHFMELRQNRQLALLKRSAKNAEIYSLANAAVHAKGDK